ncbi:ABC transporter permease [Streptomyces rapamycinicus]|uniref:ABC transporter permease n=2 Tax=Streptomyces rapamycinicus TaxID=1226757 RepID=A0A0A0N674_STRRN|nr:ABC transporter permease [Streptomyces rapamycinicus]AGP52496.1 ABC transporter permease [Streptomyces rapamycinicus NRRL 5491]MBB4779965.1 peptide/nickel transport system permease protein [Streptomyces rapamycinicus]RLV75380.1 ABC transporter permease [Streptomyces rapamycinicus NRRL 5491]UTP28674.1 ABC transporter permease [Streptomyces rapamycinicus NRRL 5491]
MLTFLIRRIAAGAALVAVVATATFLLLNLTGTDVARNILGETATRSAVAAKSHELGLDQPLVERYWHWAEQALRGDLGTSWFTGDPVNQSLMDTLPVTLSIVLAGLLIAAVLSVALGTAAALRGGWVDRVVQFAAVLGTAVPSFLIALVLAVTLAVRLGWLPATGYVAIDASVVDWLRSITLPAVSLAVAATAATAMQVRGALMDVLRADYVRTLRSRGLKPRSIVFRHALRNAAPPALTVLALQFIGLISGAVVVEKVFGLPGIGTLANSAAVRGDAPVLLGTVVVTVAIVVAVNLLLDIAYGWLNPKVRVS